jgi:hypothetical protein
MSQCDTFIFWRFQLLRYEVFTGIDIWGRGTWAASRSAFLDIPEIRRCVQSRGVWVTTFRKHFRRVVLIVKYIKNERICLAWRIFYFWPIQKIRLQKKVRGFRTHNKWHAFEIGIFQSNVSSNGRSGLVFHWHSNTKSLSSPPNSLILNSKSSNFFLKTNFFDRSKIK